MKKVVYFPLNPDNKKTEDFSKFPYLPDFSYLIALQNEFDVHVVHPEEYNFEKGTVKASYGFILKDNKFDFPEKLGEHIPEGDLFFYFQRW